MINKAFRNLLTFFKQSFLLFFDEIKSVKALVKDKNVLDILLLIFLFAYLFLSNIFSRKPFNYVYNAIFILFSILLIIKLIKTKQFVINRYLLFWLSFIVITLPINLSLKVYSLTPYVNCLNAVILFIYISTLTNELKKVAIRITYFALICYFVAVVILCTKDLLVYKSFVPFYDYRTLGNLDGLSNLLALCFLISMYYFRKGSVLSLVLSPLLIVYIALSSRRTAFLLVVVGFFALIISFLKNRSIKTKIIWWPIIIAISISFMFMPFMKEMRERLLSSINIFSNTGSTDGSSEARLGMIVRGFFYGMTNLFRPYGFERISLYVYEPSHDTFGDLAYAYGGAIAVIYSIGLIIGAINMVKKDSEYRFLRASIGFSFIFMFFLSAIFVTRTYCIIIGIICGLEYGVIKKRTPIRTDSYYEVAI